MQTIVDDKVLGTATEGVGLVTLKSNICQAYKGPRESYPEECVKLAGAQKNFPSENAAAVASANPAKPDPKVDVGEQQPAADGELELDMKEEPEKAVEAPNTASEGKTRLEMYWRAFWYVCCGALRGFDGGRSKPTALCFNAALVACRLSLGLSSSSFVTNSTLDASPCMPDCE